MIDYMVLVNPEHRLPEGFADTAEIIDAENCVGEKCKIERKTYEAFLRLREDMMENDGLQIELLSVYRTLEKQEEIFERYTRMYGPEYAKTYVSVPGHSEHHTGLAIDVGFYLDGVVDHANATLFSLVEQYAAVHKKLHKYGFILRYPKGKEAITKIGYEPWHFRYIDDPVIAQKIADQGICFEEYWENK